MGLQDSDFALLAQNTSSIMHTSARPAPMGASSSQTADHATLCDPVLLYHIILMQHQQQSGRCNQSFWTRTPALRPSLAPWAEVHVHAFPLNTFSATSLFAGLSRLSAKLQPPARTYHILLKTRAARHGDVAGHLVRVYLVASPSSTTMHSEQCTK